MSLFLQASPENGNLYLVTNILRVRAASSGWPGGPGLNTFYFVESAAGEAPIEADATLCATRVRTAFFDAKLLYRTSQTIQVSPVVDVLETETGDLVNSFTVATPTVVTGTNTGNLGPQAAMMLLRLNTNTFNDGSRLQGRGFLGPCVGDSDDDGTPNAYLIDKVTLFGTALLDGGNPLNPRVAVWRRPRAAAAGPPAVTQRDGLFGIVTGFTVPDRFAVLRSRRG